MTDDQAPNESAFRQDAEFMAAWSELVKPGYLYSDGGISKVYLGWRLAKTLAAFTPAEERDSDVAALVEAATSSAEGWANAVEFNLLPVQHWQNANDLQRQLRQALAPFTKGQNDE